MPTTNDPESKINLGDELCEIKAIYHAEIEELKAQSRGHALDDITKSIEASCTKACEQVKQSIKHFTEEETNEISFNKFLLSLDYKERVRQALLQMNKEKKAALSLVNEKTNEKLIPAQNKARSLGREAVREEKIAKGLGKQIVELEKDAKWNITHNNAIYCFGLLVLGGGDSIALKMTLTHAGAGGNGMIDMFLPVFAVIMAGLAHFLAKSILEKEKIVMGILGVLSASILLVLFLLRVIHFQ